MSTGLERDNELLFFGDDLELSEHVSSLRYASIIQKALMPDPEIIRKYLKDYFVLFMPRDIVSGDFFYTYADRNRICIAVGDCTGHGVPGALLSILGIGFLNEVMQGCITQKPNRILNLLREKVIKALKQKDDVSSAKDSFDLALCIFDTSTGILEFSGANRPLFIVRKGELIEYKGNPMTIGIAPVLEKSFTEYSVKIEKEDTCYIFSDGYCDQFGGADEKKFKYSRFRELIRSINKRGMAEQGKMLESTFSDWKGDLQQVDDVTVIGFKF